MKALRCYRALGWMLGLVLLVSGGLLQGCGQPAPSSEPTGEVGREEPVAETTNDGGDSREIAPEPPPPEPKPGDLTIQTLTVTPGQSQLLVSLAVCSQGGDGADVSVSLFVNEGKPLECGAVAALAPIATRVVTVPAEGCGTLTVRIKGFVPGSYWISAMADSVCAIQEPNEANNVARQLVALAPTQPYVPTLRWRGNTQRAMPAQRYAADLNGDGRVEWILQDDQRIYATVLQPSFHGQLYYRFPYKVARLFHGRFAASDKDTLCAIEEDGTLRCYTITAEGESLESAGPAEGQAAFLPAGDHAVAGDFNADGRDELLVYRATTKTFALYRWDKAAGFVPVESFAPGALESVQLSATQSLRVGQFGDFEGDISREDLLWIDRDKGTLQRMDARLALDGGITFVQTFSTTLSLDTDEVVGLARLNRTSEGLAPHRLVLHHRTNGALRVFAVEVDDSQQLRPLSSLLAQVTAPANAHLLWVAGEAVLADDPVRATHSALIVDEAGKTNSLWKRDTADGLTQLFQQQRIELDADPDGDAIKTYVELGGQDDNNDGISDNPLYRYKASPFTPDVFVEVDYMAKGPNEKEDHRMKAEAIQIAEASMRAKGIALHIVLSDEIPFKPLMYDPPNTYFSWTRDFDPIKEKYFTKERWNTFHYCVFGSKYKSNNSSGLSRGIGGSDFIVTFVGWGSNPGTVAQQAGTFLHELGHNLGLRHGGKDSVNHKPNNISIMSYLYQFTGFAKNGSPAFLFSEFACADLKEDQLNEKEGILCPGVKDDIRAKIHGSVVPLNAPTDFNRNGKIDDSPVKFDINRDNNDGATLTGGVDEYKILRFKVGLIGQETKGIQRLRASYTPLEPLSPDHELTEELARKLGLLK